MLRKMMIFLTAFVFTVVLCSPMAAYGEEANGVDNEFSVLQEDSDDLATPPTQTDDEFSGSQENSDDSATPQSQTVDDLIRRLEEADGYFPEGFSYKDMRMFLDEADPDTIERIMSKIEANVIPVSVDGRANDERNVPERADTYFSYNCVTGEQQELPFDTSCSTTEILESEGEYLGNNMSSAWSRGSWWWELNPEKYYDAKVVALIRIVAPNGAVYGGSGFLIGNDTLLTAGHCLYNPEDYGDKRNGWCSFITVYPCSTNENHSPYGDAISTDMIAGNYFINEFAGDDWGAVKLDTSFSIGYLGMTTNSANEKGRDMQMEGYPGFVNKDGSPSMNRTLYENYNMLTAPGKVTKDINEWCKYAKPGTVSYRGMSGGPVLYKNSFGNWVVGGIISGNVLDSLGNNLLGQIQYCAFDVNLYNKLQEFRNS